MTPDGTYPHDRIHRAALRPTAPTAPQRKARITADAAPVMRPLCRSMRQNAIGVSTFMWAVAFSNNSMLTSSSPAGAL